MNIVKKIWYYLLLPALIAACAAMLYFAASAILYNPETPCRATEAPYPVISCTVDVFGEKNNTSTYECVKADSVIAFYTPKSKGLYYLRITLHEPIPSKATDRKD